MENRLSVEEAAVIMGASAQYVREACKQQLYSWGRAVKMPGGRYSYYINRNLFSKEFPNCPEN